MIRPDRARSVACVTAQAQERRWLMQQIVGNRSMRLMANRAILGHRRMFVGKRPLFFRMAAVTDHVDRRLLQIALCLAMRIVAIRAKHLAFLDRMVRRHCVSCIDFAVALVAREWLVHGHRQARRPPDIRVLDVGKLVDMQIRMRVMAVGASNAELRMRR